MLRSWVCLDPHHQTKFDKFIRASPYKSNFPSPQMNKKHDDGLQTSQQRSGIKPFDARGEPIATSLFDKFDKAERLSKEKHDYRNYSSLRK